MRSILHFLLVNRRLKYIIHSDMFEEKHLADEIHMNRTQLFPLLLRRKQRFSRLIRITNTA